MANLYFRRFLLAWEQHGYRDRYTAFVVDYADDLVICCKPGNGAAAMQRCEALNAEAGIDGERDEDEAGDRFRRKRMTFPRVPKSVCSTERVENRMSVRSPRGSPSSERSGKSMTSTTRRWNYSTSPEERIEKLNSFLRGGRFRPGTGNTNLRNSREEIHREAGSGDG